MVDFEGYGMYPSLIHGFFKFTTKGMSTDEGEHISTEQIFVAVQTASDEMPYQQLEQEFVSEFTIGKEECNYCVVPVDSIVRPLLVYEDYGGDEQRYFSALPRRYWARYFGDEIDVTSDDDTSMIDVGDD